MPKVPMTALDAHREKLNTALDRAEKKAIQFKEITEFNEVIHLANNIFETLPKPKIHTIKTDLCRAWAHLLYTITLCYSEKWRNLLLFKDAISKEVLTKEVEKLETTEKQKWRDILELSMEYYIKLRSTKDIKDYNNFQEDTKEVEGYINKLRIINLSSDELDALIASKKELTTLKEKLKLAEQQIEKLKTENTQIKKARILIIEKTSIEENGLRQETKDVKKDYQPPKIAETESKIEASTDFWSEIAAETFPTHEEASTINATPVTELSYLDDCFTSEAIHNYTAIANIGVATTSHLRFSFASRAEKEHKHPSDTKLSGEPSTKKARLSPQDT